MKLFNLKIALFTLISALFFSSCEDIIEVKLSDQYVNLFVVDAEINSKTNPYVYLTKSTRVTDTIPNPPVGNAVIEISDNATPSNKVTLEEDPLVKGLYTAPSLVDYKGVPGRTYTLTIVVEGVAITSSQQLTAVADIDSIQLHPSLRGDSLFLGVFTFGIETPGVGNYYKWDVYRNDTLINYGNMLATASDVLVDGNYISEIEVFTDFHDLSKP